MPGKCNCRGNGFLRVILASGRGRKGGTIGCQRSFAAQRKQGSLDHSLDSVCGVQSPQMAARTSAESLLRLAVAYRTRAG